MIEWWGPVIYEYYAASEGGGTMVTPQEWIERPGTVGRAWQTAEIAIFDEQGDRLPPNEVGTVHIKMQQGFEYHRDPTKTDRAWRTDGYFTVGDAGYLDEQGYLFLCDRKADLIISGGVNIYPAEIEGVLIGHPRVLDVAVFGIPDEDWGEQVKAVVEPRGTPGPDLAEAILGWARERLAKYKCPRTVDFIETLPRDPNGKLKKRLLRDPWWEGHERQI
jgi:long-chain acyl-CoA synthetase